VIVVDIIEKDPREGDPANRGASLAVKTRSEQARRPDRTESRLAKAQALELIDKLRAEAGLEQWPADHRACGRRAR